MPYSYDKIGFNSEFIRTLSKANLEAAPPDLFPYCWPWSQSPSVRSNGAWEEGAADFLVNTKLGMNGLTELLARLENLSHILAWSDRVAWTFHRTLLWRGYVFPAWYFQEPGKRMATVTWGSISLPGTYLDYVLASLLWRVLGTCPWDILFITTYRRFFGDGTLFPMWSLFMVTCHKLFVA